MTEDTPWLEWRGAMLDVGRWFQPIEYLHQFVDELAAHRLNRFHLHLTEDQGWRVDILRYPKLTSVGAWRRGSQVGHEEDHQVDDVPHGGFYTQDELRGLVAYADERGITVVPEIDLPGHVTAVLAAYPELGNNPGAVTEVARNWGIHPTVLNAEESTLQFCRDVLDEVLAVFPSPWIHLGGDECPTVEWEASPRAGARAAELGLAGPAELQRWFTRELCAHVSAAGRRPVVWDEALGPDLPADAIVMAWRDARYGVEAAAAGHDVIMAPCQRTYFDYYQSDAPGQPLAIGGLITLRDVLTFDPTAGVADPARVLGTQGQLWTEYLPTPERIEDHAWPRLAALAEIAWSGPLTTAAEVDAAEARLRGQRG